MGAAKYKKLILIMTLVAPTLPACLPAPARQSKKEREKSENWIDDPLGGTGSHPIVLRSQTDSSLSTLHFPCDYMHSSTKVTLHNGGHGIFPGWDPRLILCTFLHLCSSDRPCGLARCGFVAGTLLKSGWFQLALN